MYPVWCLDTERALRGVGHYGEGGAFSMSIGHGARGHACAGSAASAMRDDADDEVQKMEGVGAWRLQRRPLRVPRPPLVHPHPRALTLSRSHVPPMQCACAWKESRNFGCTDWACLSPRGHGCRHGRRHGHGHGHGHGHEHWRALQLLALTAALRRESRHTSARLPSFTRPARMDRRRDLLRARCLSAAVVPCFLNHTTRTQRHT